MKKYLVIGNPISHSLSPKLHNYWLKKNNIDAVYDKKKLEEDEIKNIISEVKDEKINGLNVTVPFKKAVIPYLDELTTSASKTESVNTIYLKNKKVMGDNTDIIGFEKAIDYIKYKVIGKRILILGAGGVAPSIIFALKKNGAEEIILSNRTKEKAQNLKKTFPDIKNVDWGSPVNFDMVINATSLGLNNSDEIEFNYKKIEPNKLFFDLIYNPIMTKFLIRAKENGNQTENGKMMFLFQAQKAFEIFHGIKPNVDKSTINLLEND